MKTFSIYKTARMTAAALACAATWSAYADCPSVPMAQRFAVNADGSEVTDLKTKVIWARCSVGQTWDGSTCSGDATKMSHEEALKYAKDQSGWRLPNVKELGSLADRGCLSPAINREAFPNTPSTSYWTSSSYWSSAWFVYFATGSVFDDYRYQDKAIRLVRTGR